MLQLLNCERRCVSTLWLVESDVFFFLFFYEIFFPPKICAQVYVEVVVAEPANFFRMLVNKCWATQYNHPNNTNGSHHILIQNGWECLFYFYYNWKNWLFHNSCSSSSLLHTGAPRTTPFHSITSRWTVPTDKVRPFISTLTCSASPQNPTSSSCTVWFSCASQMIRSPASLWARGAIHPLSSVNWPVGQSVVMTVAHPLSLFWPVQNCHSVAKREAVRADPTQGLLSYGPIRIKQPQTSHSSKFLDLESGIILLKHGLKKMHHVL